MEKQLLNSMIERFTHYYNSFVTTDLTIQKNLQIKYRHSLEVSRIAGEIAIRSGLTHEDSHLAAACGLLHDISRFMQYTQYKTFSDNRSFDHGERGVDIIREESWLTFFTDAEKPVVLSAVQYHNKKKLPSDIPAHCLPFLHLVRDADKADILRVIEEHYTPGNPDRSLVLDLSAERRYTPAVTEAILQHQLVDKSLLQTVDDFRLLQLSWIFDIHYPDTLKIIHKKGHFSRLIDALPDRPETKQIRQIITGYLNQLSG